MEPLELELSPFLSGSGSGRGPRVRVVPLAGGRVQVGVAIPGHADLRGGTVSPAELAEFAARLLAFANAAALAEWRAVASVIPIRNGEHR